VDDDIGSGGPRNRRVPAFVLRRMWILSCSPRGGFETVTNLFIAVAA
jgi:hypothetical protein